MKKFKTFIVVALLFFVISPVISLAVQSKGQNNHANKEKITFNSGIQNNKIDANKQNKDSEVDVIPAELNIVDSSLAIGDVWEAKNNFVSVVMSNGEKYSFEDVAKELFVTGEVNTKKAGVYEITYSFRDLTKKAKITVSAEVMAKDFVVKNTTIPVGSNWEAKNNFDSVIMSDGSKMSWEDVAKETIVTGEVNTKKVGTYKVTYSYRSFEKVATITVAEDIVPRDMTINNSTIVIGSNWEAKNNFDSVIMSDGTKYSWEDVAKEMIVTGEVNTEKVGVYKITYDYRSFSKVAKVTVEDVKAKEIITKDSTISVGSNWNAADNFVYILLNNNTKLSWEDVAKEIVVTGDVDTSKAGVYKVDYDCRGLTKEVTVTVKDSGKPVQGSNTTKPSVNKPIKPLPQTGEANNPFLYIVGILLIIGTFSLVVFKLKKESM